MCDTQRRFLVRVVSDNCRIRISGADRRPRTTSGFFATRFVLAQNPAEAGSKTLAALLSDLSLLEVDTAAPPELTVEEIRRRPAGVRRRRSRTTLHLVLNARIHKCHRIAKEPCSWSTTLLQGGQFNIAAATASIQPPS